MKYRTIATKRKQKFWIFLSILAFTTVTAGASWAALAQDRQSNARITSLTGQITTPTSLSPSTPNPTAKPGLWVTGDSVILGIRAKLESHFPIALINARVGRQIGELIQVVRSDR